MSERLIGFRILVLGLVALGMPGTGAWAGHSHYWDFSSGLDGWSFVGDVNDVSEAALLGDENAAHSILYQIVAWGPGGFVLEFDIWDLLSSATAEGAFPDTFFASVYYVDDPATFDLQAGSFDSAIALFNLDATGITLLAGTLSASDRGPDWQHYSATLSTTHPYIIPVFEVLDYNLTPGDSNVLLDNVRIVPEAHAGILFAVGASLSLVFRVWARRRKCISFR